MIEIRDVVCMDEKAAICESILRALPDWFGIEESLVQYVADSKELPCYAAFDGDVPVGFVSLWQHTPYAAEVHVMGVLEAYHRQGVGRALVRRCIDACHTDGIEFLTVKTLDSAHPDPGYANTRRFYTAMGFRPLEIFPTLWGEENPCLLMGMWIGNAGTQAQK